MPWQLFLLYFILFVLFFKDLLTYFERESATGGGRERKRDKEQIPCWMQSHDLEITAWAKFKSQMLNQQSHPGTPSPKLLSKYFVEYCFALEARAFPFVYYCCCCFSQNKIKPCWEQTSSVVSLQPVPCLEVHCSPSWAFGASGSKSGGMCPL